MVARAVAAGIAVGAGAMMVAPQVVADTPAVGLVAIGLIFIILGMTAAGDLYSWERTNGNR